MTLPRLLAGAQAGAALSLEAHEGLHGEPARHAAALIDDVDRAGLRGRGGSSFPTATKLRSVARQRAPRAVLVNVAEGEPMSFKDRTLATCAPHLVLDGAIAAAAAVGANRIVVAVRCDAAATMQALTQAVDDRALGRRISVTPVPVAYLSGQESALIRHLDGGPLKPLAPPPRPYERGLRRRPTLVQNPETLAHIALIDRHGPDWFREIGAIDHPGSALVTVCGAVHRPGVQEIACGAALEDVLAVAGSPTETLRAVLVGGYHGTWIAADRVGEVRLDNPSLGPFGASVGAGVIVALGGSACPVQELCRAAAWLADQSAHQCGPCSNGLPALAGLLSAVATGRARPGSSEVLERWCRDVTGRGACHLPDGAARFLASGLRVFGDEIGDHMAHGPCGACSRPATLLTGASRVGRAA